MEPLRIHVPRAEQAEDLRRRLERFRAGTEVGADGRCRVVVPLERAERETVPRSLAVTREWLAACGLAVTAVELDGHAHLIRSGRPHRAAG